MINFFKKLKQLYRNQPLSVLKWTVFAVVLIVIVIHGFYIHKYFQVDTLTLIFDRFIMAIIIYIIVHSAFYFIEKQQNKLEENLNELLNSYEYIGVVNRKLDEILDLKISLETNLNGTHNYKQKAEFILTKLMNLLNASAVFIHFLDNSYHDVPVAKNNENIEECRQVFAKLNRKHFSEIINTQNNFDQAKLEELQIGAKFFEKNNIIIKPVYVNKQDIAQVYIILNKDEEIEEQDLKIIRLFAFYLAANFCFTKNSESENQNPLGI